MKWAPVILVALAAYQLSPATLFDALNYNLLWLFVLLGALGVVAAAWWVLPLFVWRGRMSYDRICDARVVRTREEGQA